MTQYPDERNAELRELFFESAQELLQTLNEEALKLEKKPGDAEVVRAIRRIVHTLKGDAAACGFRELSELAHELEDVLALESASLHASVAEVAFTAADSFSAMLAAYRGKGKVPSCQALKRLIHPLAGQPVKTKSRRKKADAEPSAVWTEYEKLAIEAALTAGKRVYHISAQIDSHCAMPIAARQLALNALASEGEVLATRPETASAEAKGRLEFLLASGHDPEQVSEKCHIPTVIAEVKVELLSAPKKKQKEAAATDVAKPSMANTEPSRVQATVDTGDQTEDSPKVSPAPVAPDTILRVDAERIDNVLNLVGELIIGKSMLQQALNEFARIYPKDVLRGRFADAMAFQSRVLNDLQRSVMKIRMVPVEQLFRRFPRLVRDVARQCGKEVDLAITGQDTDLDKSILDAISEPLTHIVRNAVSHGIETSSERTRVGKAGRGIIRLNAYHQGNQVIVEVSDDGGGIDFQKVKSKALEKGLTTPDEVVRMAENDLLELVFRPGFSTAEEITEVSGRGVGLDVVQSVMHRLKGSVQIETRPGQGTTFRLKLPLTLAIIKALLFRVEQRLYAIPLNTVAEIARSHEDEIHQVDNCEVLQLRNQVLPLIRLGHRPTGDSPSQSKIFVLVISVSERKLGLIVDALEAEEELVIKALDDQTVATELVSGASILGDGRVVLILNIPAIVETFSKSRSSVMGQISSGLLLSQSERIGGHGEVRQ